jgi:TetR/AcrR family transcriptional repressor of nem operon
MRLVARGCPERPGKAILAGRLTELLGTYILVGMTLRNPDRTREALLGAGFEEIYRHGFRSARIDRILNRTSVTKGAFYHHFPSKRALGEAVVDELIWNRIHEGWIRPIEDTDDPIPVLIRLINETLLNASEEALECGCPLGNMAQELSPVDERFRHLIHGVFERWIRAVRTALDRGQRAGRVAARVDPRQAAVFIIASLEGGIGMAKQSRDRAARKAFAGAMRSYLESLRK